MEQHPDDVELHFERLEIYRVAVDIAVEANRLSNRIRRAYPDLARQLARSSLSVPLNTAEGAGEFSKDEKVRFYRYALRSATETATSLRVVHRLEPDHTAAAIHLRKLCHRAVSMLTKLAKGPSK